jgi:hypothetical protein
MTKEIPAELSVVQYVPYDIALKHYNKLCKLEAIESAYAALIQQVRRLWNEMRIQKCGCHPQIEGVCHLCNTDHPDRMVQTIRRQLKNRKAQHIGDYHCRDVDMRVLSRTIYEMDGMTIRACNVLANLNIHTIAELIHLSREDLLKHRNCGRKTVNVIQDALEKLGLKLQRP